MKLQVLIDKKFEGNIQISKPYIRGVFVHSLNAMVIHWLNS